MQMLQRCRGSMESVLTLWEVPDIEEDTVALDAMRTEELVPWLFVPCSKCT